MSSSLSIAPSSLLTAWWRPTLGILVAALGVLMLSAGMQERPRSALPGDSLPGQQQAREAGMVPRAPPGSLHGGAMRSWGQDWVRTGKLDLASPGQSHRPADCLGADLATGQRAESAHLATILLQRPGDCGDLRDVLLMMAIRPPGSDGNRWCVPCPRSGAPPYPADNIDLVSAALFGPPERQPAAMSPEESLSNERSEVRSYLEGTATVHWLTPGFRRIMDWNETSGFGAVEAGRAAIGHEEMVSGYSATGHEASAAMGLSGDAKSGYGSVETSRAEISALVAPVAAPSWDQTSGYGVVEASRATIGHPATWASRPAEVDGPGPHQRGG